MDGFVFFFPFLTKEVLSSKERVLQDLHVYVKHVQIIHFPCRTTVYHDYCIKMLNYQLCGTQDREAGLVKK